MLRIVGNRSFCRLYSSVVTRKNSVNSESKKIECIIGLEIHAQLLTKTKLFSGAGIDGSAASNTVVADFDLGVPGTLPRLNKGCIQKSLLAALLLGSDVQRLCRFDRKHYFYPDMPMGYQITQNDYPIARHGEFEFFTCDPNSEDPFGRKRIRIKQIQLEMDSGKTIRSDNSQLFIDLNRAGIGLIEIVTEPDLRSSSEAATFVDQLRLVLVHNKICAGELHKGNMRVDANVSLRVDGQDYPRTEIKNINSIRILKSAIDNEVNRQRRILDKGEEIKTVTLNLDENGEVVVVRGKGDSLDYRFTPEPNLPRLRIEEDWIKEARSHVQGDADHLVYIKKYNIQPNTALNVVKDDRRHNFVKSTLPSSNVPVEVYFEWFKELQYACENVGERYPPTNPSFFPHFSSLVNHVYKEDITRLTCIDLIKLYLQSNISDPVDEVVSRDEYRRLFQNDPEFEN
ncbi:hypothetical protein FO519_001775 [Halicephalobus sp. NKZ332]|nr:hypothetical protein FO519_001775 [Halicephalobus sp. NKZ332]